ncbi:unnamed protein product [Boreogadus saida]
MIGGVLRVERRKQNRGQDAGHPDTLHTRAAALQIARKNVPTPLSAEVRHAHQTQSNHHLKTPPTIPNSIPPPLPPHHHVTHTTSFTSPPPHHSQPLLFQPLHIHTTPKTIKPTNHRLSINLHPSQPFTPNNIQPPSANVTPRRP